jgi:hypothetical protein
MMCLAWKTLKSFVVMLTGKVHLSNEIITVLINELWHTSKSMLPSMKGLSIYFHVETTPYSNLNYSRLGKHRVVGNDPDTYIQSNIFDHELLLLTIISMISKLGGETLSSYLPMCSMDA